MSAGTPKLQKAIAAFGPLPRLLMALGEPLSVHPPSSGAGAAARVAEFGKSLSNPHVEKMLSAGMAGVMPLLGVVFLACYGIGVQIGDMPRLAWLIFGLVSFGFALFAGGYWYYLSQKLAGAAPPPPPPPTNDPPGFILYPTGIVQVRGGKFSAIRWQDVQTVEAPAAAGYWKITARDGKQIELSAWVEDEGTTIATTIERAGAVLVPQFEKRIAAGETAMFGPFGLSRDGVTYKTKTTTWDKVTKLRYLTGSVYCLQIYCGGFIPWCTFSVLTAPNGEFIYQLLCRIAPPRLLKQAS